MPMLSSHEAQSYEQQSIRRTLCCASCNKALKKGETHVCDECDLKMCMNNLVFHVTGKDMEDENG
ncbi:protein NinF [Enterobacter bugandensis]|uniref:protein NinF n=1 Tax=Enterobacter bugandensis TaxID=881260 RepID=UPI0032119BF8